MVTTKNRKQKRGMKFMIKATLVLEGGANRGVFTSGVLDYLMGKELYMSNVIGVSEVPAMQLIMYQNRLDGAGNA